MFLSRLAPAALAFVFLGAGCISLSSGPPDGGLFLSQNFAEAWEQRGAVLSVGGGQSLVQTDIRFITQDVGDPLALYAGTFAAGAYASWDGGASWRPLGTPFAQARVEAIALHSTDRCTFAVASGLRVYRSDDCGRSWDASDFDVAVTALAVDPRNPSVLYAGNAKGDILQSVDGGRSWRAIERLNNRIERIATSVLSSQTYVLVVTKNQGLRRSMDGGRTWTDLREGMEDFAAAFDFRDLAFAHATPGTVFHASKYGILRSRDAGTTWEAVPLLTAAGSVDITAIGIDPTKSDTLVYATASTFYRSTDGGQHWESSKLPTSRRITAIHVDRRSGKLLWLGTQKVEKSSQ